jgi:2,4-dienoyl-CoA reductase-like NADH-dependent reductase (Old Yellow Enzyme family)
MLILQPYELHPELILKNRIIMAPMTRRMADDNLCPNELSIAYYTSRAAAGLIITEGTIINGVNAQGYPRTPGIFTKQQVTAWKRITDSVHAQQGHIFCQIWHVGRVSHPHFLNGELPVGPSAGRMSGPLRGAGCEGLVHGANRALSVSEIYQLIEEYAQAARAAINAGFDGVELHGANGYLIDQFLHYDTNRRDDEWGGIPEHMARFALEVVKACGDAIGYHRVGIRLTPGTYLNEIAADPRDAAVFEYLLEALNAYPIAYVHTGTFDDRLRYPALQDQSMTEFLRSYYKGTLIACGSYDLASAEQGLQKQAFDLIAFGRPFIANPDLVAKIQNQIEWNAYSVSMLEQLV